MLLLAKFHPTHSLLLAFTYNLYRGLSEAIIILQKPILESWKQQQQTQDTTDRHANIMDTMMVVDENAAVFYEIHGWNTEIIIELLRIYESNSCLYDPTHANYRNKTLRNNVYEEIASCIGKTVPDIKKKIDTLRTQYMREKLKQKQQKKNGSGTDQLYISKWVFMPYMQFLDPYLNPKPTITNVQCTSPESIELSDLDGSSLPATTHTYKEHTTDNLIYVTDQCTSSHKVKTTDDRHLLGRAVAAMENMGASTSTRNVIQDDLDLFGKVVVAELRNITDNVVRKRTQKKIMNLLYDAQIGE